MTTPRLQSDILTIGCSHLDGLLENLDRIGDALKGTPLQDLVDEVIGDLLWLDKESSLGETYVAFRAGKATREQLEAAYLRYLIPS